MANAGFNPRLIFLYTPEVGVKAVFLKSSIKDYLDKLSSPEPVPGGGGTSALVAALGISLILMVARISLRRLDRNRQRSLSKTIALLERFRRDAKQIIDLDPKIYKEVMASYARLKRAGNKARAKQDIESTLANSFRLQADLALLIVMAKGLLRTVDGFAKGSIRNDLLVASGLLDGAFRGAWATARINVVYMREGKQRRHFAHALRKLEQRLKRIHFE